jgi:hypothetical protein
VVGQSANEDRTCGEDREAAVVVALCAFNSGATSRMFDSQLAVCGAFIAIVPTTAYKCMYQYKRGDTDN